MTTPTKKSHGQHLKTPPTKQQQRQTSLDIVENQFPGGLGKRIAEQAFPEASAPTAPRKKARTESYQALVTNSNVSTKLDFSR